MKEELTKPFNVCISSIYQDVTAFYIRKTLLDKLFFNFK